MSNLINTLISLFRQSADAVIAATPDGEIVFCNPAAYKLFKANESDRELRLSDIFHAPMREGSWEFVTSVVFGDVLYTVTSAHIDDILVLTFYAQDERSPAVEAAMPAVNELRTELFNVKLALEGLIRRESDPHEPKFELYSSSLYHNYYSMLRLVNNIDAAGSLLKGDLLLIRETVDLCELCRELCDSVKIYLDAFGIALRYEEKAPELTAYVDADRIRHILLNLISNSIRHCKRSDTIKLTLELSGDRAMLGVIDSGSGIAPDELSGVFTRFNEPRSLDKLDEGAGYGLFIARGIAMAHGGTLLIESREGQGTAAYVTLPRNVDESMLCTPRKSYYSSLGEIVLTELSCVLDREDYTVLFTD